MKKLLILSGKGGTGKTTVAAAFIRFSEVRAFADCDVDAPNLHLVTGTLGNPETSDFLGSDKAVIDPEKCIDCGKCEALCRFDAINITDGCHTVDEFACEGCGVCEWFCPQKAVTMQEDAAGEIRLYRYHRIFSTAELKMGRGNSGKLVSEVKRRLSETAKDESFAIIDGSPGIGCPVIASISGVDMVLIVAEPSLSGISDMERILETAAVFETKAVVCVNKWDTSPHNTGTIKRFCSENNIPYVGQIPFDRQASFAINAGTSIADIDCPASKALRQTFERVMDMLTAGCDD